MSLSFTYNDTGNDVRETFTEMSSSLSISIDAPLSRRRRGLRLFITL